MISASANNGTSTRNASVGACRCVQKGPTWGAATTAAATAISIDSCQTRRWADFSCFGMRYLTSASGARLRVMFAITNPPIQALVP